MSQKKIVVNDSVILGQKNLFTLILGMAMGTLWVGYYSAHPHTRVSKESPYPSPYPCG